MGNSAKVRKQAKQLKGRKVCITLHDGRTYVGWITGCEKETVILSAGPRTRSKSGKTPSRAQRAEVSAFMPLLGPLLGGLGGMGGAGGAGGAGLGGIMGGGLRFFGMIQRAMPVMKMGYGMIKQIRPFMEGLKGLMGR
ncbi:hypothetical protein D3C81_1592920 [compost metagenome]